MANTTQPKMKDHTKVAFSGPPKVSNFPHSTNFKDLGIMFRLESLNFIKLGVYHIFVSLPPMPID